MKVTDIKPEIKLKRPPVVLVHGTWGTPSGTWNEFKPIVNGDSGKYFVANADYSKAPYSSVGSLAQNYLAIPDSIDIALNMARDNGFAATKVDIIAHSLGGLVIREYCRRAPSSSSDTIRKIITLDSTHLGTELADVFLDNRLLIDFIEFITQVANVFGASFQKIDGQALDDQAPKSAALALLAKSPLPIPMHKIVGKTPDQNFGYVAATTGLWKTAKKLFNLVPDESFPASETWMTSKGQTRTIIYKSVFPPNNDQDRGRNDRIVSMRSQKNGDANNTTVFGNVDHVTIHGDSAVLVPSTLISCVNQLLEANDTDSVWIQGCK